MTVEAPTSPIGYVSDHPQGFWLYDPEESPDLQWPLSVAVYNRMRTDSQVKSVLMGTILPVMRARWRVEPNGADPAVVQHVATDLGLPIVGADRNAPTRRSRNRFSWADHLEHALLKLTYGHSFAEQQYDYDKSTNRLHLRKLAPRMPHTIARINVARDGGLVSIEQFGTDRPIPVDRLVAYVREKEGGNWYGTSLLRPMYKYWLLKDRLLRTGYDVLDRNGMGIAVYTDGPDGNKDSMAAGLATVRAMRASPDSGAAGPNGSEYKLMAPDGDLPDLLRWVEYYDNQMARAGLMHFLNLGGDNSTGSYALGETFAEFFTLQLQALADSIRDVANAHVVEDIVDVNFGTDAPAPLLVCDEIGANQAATAQAIKFLLDSGALFADPALEEFLRHQFKLPPKAPRPPRDAAA